MRPYGFGLRDGAPAAVAFDAWALSPAVVRAVTPLVAPDDDDGERSPQPRATRPIGSMTSAATILLCIGKDLRGN
jgi:hypothetical protein